MVPVIPNGIRRKAVVLFAAIVIASLSPTGCSRNSAPTKADNAVDHAANDSARFLAGLPGRMNSGFRPFEDSASWQKYSSELSATWARVEKDQFDAVDLFQKRELAPAAGASDFTFYPLSGPDVLYATRFFPATRVFVFAGLEPVGNIRNSGSYTKELLDQELHGWSQGVSSIFERSFFVTGEMDRQFRGRVADGILPMILLLLSRSGHKIEGIHYGQLDNAGAFIAEGPGNSPPLRHQGVEIRFRRGTETLSRKLFYFSTDLGSAFETNPSFANFLRSLGTPSTLIKSASFLLHWKMCSGLRR